MTTQRKFLNSNGSKPSIQQMASSPIVPLKESYPSPMYYDSTDALLRTDVNPPEIDPTSIEIASRRFRTMYWLQVISTLLLIILIVLFFVYHYAIYEWMESYIQLIKEQGVFFAPICYMITCYLSICLMIPQTLLTMFGGFIFVKLLGLKGIITAIFIEFFGCSLGAIQSFINSRYLYQKSQCIKNLLKDYNDYDEIYTMSKKQKYDGFKLIFYVRMIPWTPYNYFNLAIASTKISLIHFIIGNVGMIPDIVLYTFMGAFIDSISRVINNDNSHDWASAVMIVTFIGSLSSIFVMIYIGKIAYNKYKAIINKTAPKQSRIFHHGRQHSYESSSGTIKEVSLGSNVSDLI